MKKNAYLIKFVTTFLNTYPNVLYIVFELESFSLDFTGISVDQDRYLCMEHNKL